MCGCITVEATEIVQQSMVTNNGLADCIQNVWHRRTMLSVLSTHQNNTPYYPHSCPCCTFVICHLYCQSLLTQECSSIHNQHGNTRSHGIIGNVVTLQTQLTVLSTSNNRDVKNIVLCTVFSVSLLFCGACSCLLCVQCNNSHISALQSSS